MTLEEKDKKALIKYKIERSEEAIKSAKRGFEADDMFGSVNRIYYACYYSTEALLLTKGLSFSSHGQLIGAFNREFVHGGLIDKKYSEILGDAFKKRQTGDYGDFIKFDKEEIKSSLRDAEEFVQEVNKITMNYVNGN
ncbi:MAG: HEPN domain-containing protein [bacterium]